MKERTLVKSMSGVLIAAVVLPTRNTDIIWSLRLSLFPRE